MTSVRQTLRRTVIPLSWMSAAAQVLRSGSR
jgi:hypothetical protein